MSTEDTWRKLGEGSEDVTRPAGLDTLHGVGDGKAKWNNPMDIPFLVERFERTTPNVRPVSFGLGDVVVHGLTAALYVILDTPQAGVCLERTGELAYVYKRVDDASDPRKWVRCQSEMEDGRFTMHRPAPARR